MNPTPADVKRATDMAHALEAQGYFVKVKDGDEKAASYFSRMVASKVNPSGNPNDWGWLSKPSGGFNIEGYADGAIVFGNNPSDLNNVLKIVTQVGSNDPNAIQIGSSVQERRPSDIWVVPVPLPDSIPNYLHTIVPSSMVPWVVYDENGFQELKRELAYDYTRRPQGADFDVSVWAARTFHNAFMGPDKTPLGMTAGIARARNEWCAALGVPVIPVPANWHIGDPV